MFMAKLTRNIGISILLEAIICVISFPGLTLTASAQPVKGQASQNSFHQVVTDPDFNLYAFPSYFSTTAGDSVNSTVLVMSRYGFNDTVSLSASVPDGWNATFTPDSLSPANGYYGYYHYYGGYARSVLSIAVPAGTETGKYTVVVTGTSGTLTHSANVTVNVFTPFFWGSP
jgi:uncharacterized membrane protein